MATATQSRGAKGVSAKAASHLNGHANSGAKIRSIEPILNQRGPILQEYGTVRHLPIGLEADVRQQIVDGLNQVLADTIMLTSMYKKHHWQVSGHTFYQLHLLFDKHYAEQSNLVDVIAERIMLLGGVSNGMPSAVAKITKIEDPPSGVEDVPTQVSRLLEAHELIITEAREIAEKAGELGDSGTEDLLVSEIVRLNELQVWFVASHVVDEPLVHAGE